MTRQQQRAVQRLQPKVDAALAADAAWAAAHPDRQHRIRLVRAAEVEMIQLTQKLPPLRRGARRCIAVVEVGAGVRHRMIFNAASSVIGLPEADARAVVRTILALGDIVEIPSPC